MEKNKVCFHEASFIDQDGQLRTTKVPVVQELVRQGLKDMPKRFIKVHHPDHPSKTPYIAGDVPDALPVINVENLRPGCDIEVRALELAKLASGIKDWGMFLVENCGVDSSTMDGVKDVVKSFFALSFEEKKACVGTYRNFDNMGYGRNFVTSEDQPLDWIDRLTMKAAPKGMNDDLLVWPQTPTNFRQVIEKYVDEARTLCDELLQALAEALTLERREFIRYFDPKDSEINVRVNYYPPCPRPDLAMGITPHSDASALTLLMQFDTTGALQVLRDKKWVTVPWPSETILLVNVGDLLEIMSNGSLKSPWHRAVTHKEKERFSVALFYNPPSREEIEPAKSVAKSNEDYKKVVVGDYVQHFYKISPTKEKEEAMMFAKVDDTRT